MRTAATAILLAALVSGAAEAAQWQVDPAKSKLGYVVVWAKEPFKADFKKWTADIDFEPADLAHAKVNVTIDIAGMVSEDPENDKYRVGPNGLDFMHFAQARFISKSFRSLGGNRYEATADLSVHGIGKEVKLPFTLTIMGNTAHMVGETTISRAEFGVGKGNTFGIDWASERTVAHAVKVVVDLTATQLHALRQLHDVDNAFFKDCPFGQIDFWKVIELLDTFHYGRIRTRKKTSTHSPRSLTEPQVNTRGLKLVG